MGGNHARAVRLSAPPHPQPPCFGRPLPAMTPVMSDSFLARLRDRLDPLEGESGAVRGDGDLNGAPSPSGLPLRPAAVLAPLILHDGPPRFLLTLRAGHLSAHAGQIAFPGGRLEPGETPVEAVLRETREETGIGPAHVDLIGRLDAYETVTQFRITPFVGVLRPGYVLKPDPGEVADLFEAPVDFLMNPDNHLRHEREFQGVMRSYYAMPWEGRYIWGATAGMLKALYDRLYG